MPLAYLDVVAPDGLTSERLHETGVRAVVSAPGLIGATAVRGGADELPEADGVIEPEDLWRSGRVIVVTGEIWGATPEASRLEFAAIDKAFRAGDHARGVLARFRWDDAASPDLQGWVRLVGDLTAIDTPGSSMIAYQAQLRAASPYWTSQTQKSATVGAQTATVGLPVPLPVPLPLTVGGGGASVACSNTGNGKAWPVITITGSITGPVVQNMATGALLAFPGLTLGDGQQLVIDTDPISESVTVAGATSAGSLRWDDAEFPGIDANSTQSFLFYGIGGGYGAGTTMTVAWRDTYTT